MTICSEFGIIIELLNADMAESADALDSGSSGSNTVCVQVTLSAPRKIGTFKASALEVLFVFNETF